MLARCFKSNFCADFEDDIEAVKRHLQQLKEETTLAHRSTVHDFMRCLATEPTNCKASQNMHTMSVGAVRPCVPRVV